MYPNVWNIKEILNTSNGGSKSSGRSGSTSDYSSGLTDSQFLFGSQFCADQIGLSQEMSLPSKNSQQNSQEVNEPKVSTNYHTKPYLFGGDSKDKSKMPNFTNSKTKGILEQFEEEKKKAKEKTESEMLVGELSQLKECMENMKNSLRSMDGNTDSTKRVVVEALDGFTKTLQGAVGSIQEGFAVQLGAVLDKLSCHLEALRDMEDRESKMVSEVATLATCVHSLQGELESLRTEQAREQYMMGEILSSLQALASTQPPSAPVADIGVQTSPCPWERLCLVSEKTRYFQSLQLNTRPAPLPQGEVRVLGPLQPIEQEPSPTSEPNLRAGAHTEALADITCETHGQKPYRTHSATTRPPGVRNGAAGTWAREAEVAHSLPGATLENPGLLTQEDGGIHRTGGVPKQAGRPRRAAQRGQRTRVPKRRRKALPPCGGQGNGNRGREIMPAPTSCQRPANHTSENAGVLYNPCAGWSQDSSSTQFVSRCETTTASRAIPISEAETGITQKGFWQLFDFCDDSD